MSLIFSNRTVFLLIGHSIPVPFIYTHGQIGGRPIGHGAHITRALPLTQYSNWAGHSSPGYYGLIANWVPRVERISSGGRDYHGYSDINCLLALYCSIFFFFSSE